MASERKSRCTHLFEQMERHRLIGMYAMCDRCRKVVYAPHYATCVRCDKCLCTYCILFEEPPTVEQDAFDYSYSELNGEHDTISEPWDEVTEEFIIDVKAEMEKEDGRAKFPSEGHRKGQSDAPRQRGGDFERLPEVGRNVGGEDSTGSGRESGDSGTFLTPRPPTGWDTGSSGEE